MIRRLVGQCHVGDTPAQVIHFVLRRIIGGYTTFRAMPRENRRAVIEEIRRVHKENGDLFRKFRF